MRLIYAEGLALWTFEAVIVLLAMLAKMDIAVKIEMEPDL